MAKFGVVAPYVGLLPLTGMQPESAVNEIEWKNWLLENNIKCYKELWTCVQFLNNNDYLIVDINPVVTDAGMSTRRDKLFLLVPKDFAKKNLLY